MTHDELMQLLPDLVDGSLADDIRTEAEASLSLYPDIQQDLDIARQIRTLLATMQADYPQLRVPAGFEVRLLARVRQQYGGLEVLDLSCTAFAVWLVEFINLVGGLLAFLPTQGKSAQARA